MPRIRPPGTPRTQEWISTIGLGKHKGAHSELIACAWLLSQGYEVFRNVSAVGLTDVIAQKGGRGEFGMSQLEQFAPATDLELDPGIRRAVLVLRSAGVETFESCEGGPGHAFPDPTVKFHGGAWAGYRAFAVAMEHGLSVLRVQQVHGVANGQLEGPWWELVFRTTVKID